MAAEAETQLAFDVDDRVLAGARETLARAGYDESAVCHALGVEAVPYARRRTRDLDFFLERTSGDTPLDHLIRLFLLYQPADREVLKASLDVELLEKAGLLKDEWGRLRTTFELLPYAELLLASDLPGSGPKQVMGIAASTIALQQFTIRRPVESVLDLGTGCGVQAIIAARHARHVMAVDVNSRAVDLARFNARLNGTGNIEFAAGNLFEPAKGRKFDLIVCNPPFVVGPAVSPVHTSSGETGDHFCERILREAPMYLNEGGFAQILCNWVERADESGLARMISWLEANGCDAWVLHSHTETADEYARARATENATGDGDTDRLYDRWGHYLEREGVTGVNFGLVTLRRSSKAKNWLRYDEIPGAKGYCGRSVEVGFLLHDFVENHKPDELLDAHVVQAPDVAIRGKGPDNAERKLIRLESGLTFSIAADDEVAKLVESCTGGSTLRSYVQKLAAKRHVPVSYLLPGFLSVVRPLVEFGFLLPVEVASKLEP